MPKERPIIVKAFTVTPDTTVGDAIDLLQKHGVRCMPVVDADRKLVGWFSFMQVFKFMLPAAVTMEGGLSHIDFAFDTAPGAAKRLGKLQDRTVAEVMLQDCPRLNADTPTWEMLRLLMQHGSPLPVIDAGSEHFLGIVSDQSVLESLEEVLKDLQAEGQV